MFSYLFHLGVLSKSEAFKSTPFFSLLPVFFSSISCLNPSSSYLFVSSYSSSSLPSFRAISCTNPSFTSFLYFPTSSPSSSFIPAHIPHLSLHPFSFSPLPPPSALSSPLLHQSMQTFFFFFHFFFTCFPHVSDLYLLHFHFLSLLFFLLFLIPATSSSTISFFSSP